MNQMALFIMIALWARFKHTPIQTIYSAWVKQQQRERQQKNRVQFCRHWIHITTRMLDE